MGREGTVFLQKGFPLPAILFSIDIRNIMSKNKVAARSAPLFESAPGLRPLGNERRHPAQRTPQGGPAAPAPFKALELALHIHTAGYNIYLSGESNLGRTYMLRQFLEPRIRKAQTPPDLLYVNNFDDPDRPMPSSVPAGQGKKLAFVSFRRRWRISARQLPVRLDNEKYVKKRSELQDCFQAVRSGLIKQMDKTAGKEGFNLDMDEQGSLTLYPLVEGKRLSEDEYEHLDPTLRQGLKQKGDTLLRAMSGMVRKLNSAEQSFRSDERTLEQEVIGSVLSAVLIPPLWSAS